MDRKRAADGNATYGCNLPSKSGAYWEAWYTSIDLALALEDSERNVSLLIGAVHVENDGRATQVTGGRSARALAARF
jgi:hypothetical protein